MQGEFIGRLAHTPVFMQSELKMPPAAGMAGVPFRTAEEAWFWFICAVEAREQGAVPGKSKGEVQRPCEPMDIYRILERLHRGRRLRFEHMRVLSHYGRRMAPEFHRQREAHAHQLWREAMKELDISLQRRGIVRNIFQQAEQ